MYRALFKSANIIYLQSSTDYNETDEKGTQNGGQTSYSCMEQRPSRKTKGWDARLRANEMRMLRWMCGVKKMNNEHIRGTTSATQASKKKITRGSSRVKTDIQHQYNHMINITRRKQLFSLRLALSI